MYTQTKKSKDDLSTARQQQSRAVANSFEDTPHPIIQGFGFTDNRPQAVIQRALRASFQSGTSPIQFGKRKRDESESDEDDRQKKKRKIAEDNMPDYYLNKHYNFKLEDDSEDEIYNQHVDDLVDGLDYDRHDLEFYIEKKRSGKDTYKRKKIQKLISTSKRNITEKVGELNATQYMDKYYPSARLILGYSKGIGIDQVYEDGDTIYIVEAKGPGAKLGTSDRKGKQMSRQWVLDTTMGMSNKKVKKKILTAHKLGNLRGILVPSTPSGNYTTKTKDYHY